MAVESSFDEALDFERKTFLDLRGSEQAAALRTVFFAERAARRPAGLKGVEPLPLRKAGVVGGGTMGAGITAALRDAGIPVVLIERDAEAVARGLANVRAIFEGGVKRAKLTKAQAEAKLAGVTASTGALPAWSWRRPHAGFALRLHRELAVQAGSARSHARSPADSAVLSSA